MLPVNSPPNFFWTNIFAGRKVRSMKKDRLHNVLSIIC
jgi:hypothetical protein